MPFIKKCHCGKVVPQDLIFQCIGIICVNAIGFNFDKSGKQGRALYATTVLGTIHKYVGRIIRNDYTSAIADLNLFKFPISTSNSRILRIFFVKISKQ